MSDGEKQMETKYSIFSPLVFVHLLEIQAAANTVIDGIDHSVQIVGHLARNLHRG